MGPELDAALLAELDEGARILSALRGAYNARARISQIPNELLLDIFSILRDVWEPNGNYEDLGWLNISFVCRSWRSLALETSSLWTYHSLFFGVTWANIFFERARSAPMSLSAIETSSWSAADTLHRLKDSESRMYQLSARVK